MFEEKRDDFLFRLAEYFERDFAPKRLAILFSAGLFGNALSWLAAIFAPASVGETFSFLVDVTDKVLHYFLIFPFFFGFLTAFSVCKYFFRKKDRPLVPDNEFLGGYSGQLVKENLRRILPASAMFGGINTIFLIVSTIWFR